MTDVGFFASWWPLTVELWARSAFSIDSESQTSLLQNLEQPSWRFFWAHSLQDIVMTIWTRETSFITWAIKKLRFCSCIGQFSTPKSEELVLADSCPLPEFRRHRFSKLLLVSWSIAWDLRNFFAGQFVWLVILYESDCQCLVCIWLLCSFNPLFASAEGGDNWFPIKTKASDRLQCLSSLLPATQSLLECHVLCVVGRRQLHPVKLGREHGGRRDVHTQLACNWTKTFWRCWVSLQAE